MKSYLLARRSLILTWFAGLLLAYQVLNYHTYIEQVVDTQAVIAATDDDASQNIQKTLKTRWWKDNGWALYGPLYFRLNHSVQYLWGATANPPGTGEQEAWERTAHHAVLTTSLLSIVGVSLLIGCALLELWWARLFFAFAMNAAFLENSARAEFLLRAHPDHLFSFVMTAAFFLTAIMFFRPLEPVWRKLSACVWGFAVAVKMTVVICTPGFLLLFVPPFKRERWIAGLRYVGVMFLAYFLVGFPQTIVLDRPVRDILKQGSLSAPATFESVGHWLLVYGAELWAPLIVLLAGALFLGRLREWPKLDVSWVRLGAFVFLPFLLLLRNRILVPADHYPIPFVAMLLIFVALLLTKIPKFRYERWILFLAVGIGFTSVSHSTLQAALNKNLVCRPESREAYAMISKLYDAGEKIWVDPYVPYPASRDPSRIDVNWDKTWEAYAKNHWTVIGINRSYRDRFAAIVGDAVDPYTASEHTGWKETREFYRPFLTATEAHGPDGEVFQRIYANACGVEIWKLR